MANGGGVGIGSVSTIATRSTLFRAGCRSSLAMGGASFVGAGLSVRCCC